MPKKDKGSIPLYDRYPLLNKNHKSIENGSKVAIVFNFWPRHDISKIESGYKLTRLALSDGRHRRSSGYAGSLRSADR